MKTKYGRSLPLVALILSTICGTAHAGADSMVVHEWGTFTSFQGGDGVLLDWKPLQASSLPDFVYNWSKPGFGRVSTRGASSNSLGFGGLKNSVTAKQRMETPVVYFYSEAEQTVDLTVKFPDGLITEWFPQADLVGPSTQAASQNDHTDLFQYGVPVSPATSTTGLGDGAATKESLIRWSNLRLLPPGKTGSPTLNPATAGSHYFAARETDSDYISSTAISGAGPQSQAKVEIEKFLFYRGAGNFATPLRVTMKSDDAVVLANTGKDTLAHLFILGVKDKAGNFVTVSALRPGEERTISIQLQTRLLPGEELSAQIGDSMAKALVQSGLFPREAKAMVNTWRDSWFQENGLRVLYVLPRGWTDQTLPMTLNPAPKDLVRVMVGRAEVLPPGVEQNLVRQFNNAKQGNVAASVQAREILKSLGRFAEPAFYRVLAETKPQPEEQGRLLALLNHGSAAE